jgi:hypothetical protein
LRKRIANDFNKATLFRNAPGLANTDLLFSVQTPSFVQASAWITAIAIAIAPLL